MSHFIIKKTVESKKRDEPDGRIKKDVVGQNHWVKVEHLNLCILIHMILRGVGLVKNSKIMPAVLTLKCFHVILTI